MRVEVEGGGEDVRSGGGVILLQHSHDPSLSLCVGKSLHKPTKIQLINPRTQRLQPTSFSPMYDLDTLSSGPSVVPFSLYHVPLGNC